MYHNEKQYNVLFAPGLAIGVDIDGVLADLAPLALQVINEKFGSKLTKNDIDSWDAIQIKANITRQELLEALDYVWLHRDVSLLEDDAPSVLEKLMSMGVHVTIISKRTRNSLPAVVAWLNDKQIPYHHIVFMAEDTHLNSKFDYPIQALVDDSPRAVESIRYSFQTLFLRNQPWNVNLRYLPKNVLRINSIKEVLEYVRRP